MSEDQKRRGRPNKITLVPKERVEMPAGSVRVQITSEKHAFSPDGTKHWFGERLTVPQSVADDWIKHGRAAPL
jgi:hypothetical protein